MTSPGNCVNTKLSKAEQNPASYFCSKDQFMDQFEKTSQELRMLSSVALNCQVTMIVLNLGLQLSEMSKISHKLKSHVMLLSWSLYLSLSFVFDQVMYSSL